MVNFDPNGNFLFSEEEFNAAKSRDKLPLRCLVCGETFYRCKNRIQAQLKGNTTANKFCSLKCFGASNVVEKVKCKCKQCGKDIEKLPREIATSGNVFCSHNCAATYSNAHRAHRDAGWVTSTKVTCDCAYCGKELQRIPSRISKSGKTFCSSTCFSLYYKDLMLNNLRTPSLRNRSRLERFLEQELPKVFPDLEVIYNDRKVCDGLELDIYIPSLQLAFELNGPVHYQPVFGKTPEEREERFGKVVRKDIKKQWICQDKGITLCIINVSRYKHASYKNDMEFLHLIVQCIQDNM